jgi:fumarate hydratase class II
MNVNEVISNCANQILGFLLGQKKPVHPNDHVNLSGSSNGGFATAIHIAAVLALRTEFLPHVVAFKQALREKQTQFDHFNQRLAAHHLQDAVPLNLGQEFWGFATHISLGIQRIKAIMPELQLLALPSQ